MRNREDIANNNFIGGHENIIKFYGTVADPCDFFCVYSDVL